MLIRVGLALAALFVVGLPDGRAEDELPDYTLPGGVSGQAFDKRTLGTAQQPFPSNDTYVLPMISTDPLGNPYSRSCTVAPSPVISVSCN